MSKPIVIGVIGFGTVATGVIRHLLEKGSDDPTFHLKRVAVAQIDKPREIEFPHLTDDVEEILEDPEIQVVVELMGTEKPALDYIVRALENGKRVVTANKAVIARHSRRLFQIARRNSVDLAFEASVAGGVPIIRTLRGFQGEKISKIIGILNGTTNYILSRMEEGLDFDSALELAQKRGFAEAEHFLDTGGHDARDKLAILASIVYNTEIHPETIYCEGITGITPIDLDFAAKYGVEEGGPGYAVKLLAAARMSSSGLEMHVYPALIPREHQLAPIRDEYNAVYIEGVLCGPQLYQGKGAGRDATSSAVISDLRRVGTNINKNVTDELPPLDSEVKIANLSDLVRRGYVRINLKHKPGSLHEATGIFKKHGFNIEDSIQRRRFSFDINGNIAIPDVITAEPLSFDTVEQALEELAGCDGVHGRPFYLRFEE